MSSGTLHVAATPIGNLGDASARLRDVLASCAIILCEDTRRTRKLCHALEVTTPLVRCDEHEELRRIPEVLELLRSGKDVALVTDAGTPAISDPGHRLVRAVHEAGCAVSPVPGPSALVAALSASGLPATSFAFEGFLPRKRSARRKLLAALADEPRTLVFFESPWRLAESLADLASELGETRRASMSRELTKIHECVELSTLGRLRDAHAGEIKGEVVLVVEAATEGGVRRDSSEIPSREELGAEIDRLVEEGASHADALRSVAKAHGLGRRDLYRIVKIDQEDDAGSDVEDAT